MTDMRPSSDFVSMADLQALEPAMKCAFRVWLFDQKHQREQRLLAEAAVETNWK